jgi:hypothetical protein
MKKQTIILLALLYIAILSGLTSCKKNSSTQPSNTNIQPVCDSTECIGLSANDLFIFKSNINTDTTLIGKTIRGTWTGVSDTIKYPDGVIQIKHEYRITSNTMSLTNVISPTGLKFWAWHGGIYQGIELKFKSGKKATFYNERL